MYINGDVKMIEVTDRAAAELKVLLGNNDISGMPFRIYITGSTADAQYGLELADEVTDYDIEMENNGINLVMIKTSLLVLKMVVSILCLMRMVKIS